MYSSTPTMPKQSVVGSWCNYCHTCRRMLKTCIGRPSMYNTTDFPLARLKLEEIQCPTSATKGTYMRKMSPTSEPNGHIHTPDISKSENISFWPPTRDITVTSSTTLINGKNNWVSDHILSETPIFLQRAVQYNTTPYCDHGTKQRIYMFFS